MSREDRLQRMQRLFRMRRSISMNQLMTELEVKRATVTRYLSYLKNTFGIPILWDSTTRGYRVAGTGIQHLEVANNTHMFSSPNTDLRFLGAFFKKLRPEDLQFAELGGIPAAAIITFIGYGGAPVNVFRWENRLVLNNGFHRLFALRSLGVTSVPVVVQHVQNIQLEFPSIVGGLPREYLLGVARPVLMKDFFEDGFCVTLNAKRRVRGISVQAAVGQFDVPS